jgi:hypothetical protein
MYSYICWKCGKQVFKSLRCNRSGLDCLNEYSKTSLFSSVIQPFECNSVIRPFQFSLLQFSLLSLAVVLKTAAKLAEHPINRIAWLAPNILMINPRTAKK